MADGSVARKTENWPVICLTAVVGFALVALAVIADVRWGWEDIWPSVFLDIGVSIMLAAVLFVLQRFFLREVRALLAVTISDHVSATDSIQVEVTRGPESSS